MSAHTWDAHRQSEVEYRKEWWYFCISVGWIFSYTLKCKVDFHFPISIESWPEYTVQTRWLEVSVVLPPPRYAITVKFPSRTFSFFTEATGEGKKKKKKRNKHQCWGRNIGYAHDAWRSLQSPKMWVEGVMWRAACACTCFTVWVMIWLTYLKHVLWWFRVHDEKTAGWINIPAHKQRE